MAKTTDQTCDANDPDQEICMCFHVSRRKIENFIRIQQPKRPAQLSDCFGAGTGCGWCRRYLTMLFDAHQSELTDSAGETIVIPAAHSYQQMRQTYRDSANQ